MSEIEPSSPRPSGRRIGKPTGRLIGKRSGGTPAASAPARPPAPEEPAQLQCPHCEALLRAAVDRCRYCNHSLARKPSAPAAPPIRGELPYPTRELATPSRRLGAVLLDGLVAVAGVVTMLLVSVAMTGAPGSRRPGELQHAIGMAFVLGALLPLTVQWYLLAAHGASLGKGWLGIRIVKNDGSPAGFVHALLLRQWPRDLLSGLRIGWLILLPDALLIFSEGHRCGHDLVAGTQVVVDGAGVAPCPRCCRADVPVSNTGACQRCGDEIARGVDLAKEARLQTFLLHGRRLVLGAGFVSVVLFFLLIWRAVLRSY